MHDSETPVNIKLNMAKNSIIPEFELLSLNEFVEITQLRLVNNGINSLEHLYKAM